MKSLSAHRFVVGFCVLSMMYGCAHPFLKAGGDLATTIDKGAKAADAIATSDADTERTYTYLADYRPTSKVTVAADGTITVTTVKHDHGTDPLFFALVCRPYSDQVLISERVAIDNLEKFQASLATKAKDPTDPTIATLIGDLSSSAAQFKPKDFDKAVEELQAKRKADAADCIKRADAVMNQAPVAGAAVVPAVLAAWPKISALFTALLTEADKAKREKDIIALLTDSKNQDAMKQSLDELTRSATSGRLAGIIVSQKQMALWGAYAYFVPLSALKSDTKRTQPYEVVLHDAKEFAAMLKTYDSLDSANLPDAIKQMQTALTKMQDAAKSGKAPGDSDLAELLAAIQFVSDTYGKYNDAVSALHPTASSSKKK